jgi:putative membrane-bound dehydrogenase-like protein
MRLLLTLTFALLLPAVARAQPGKGNRLAYLDEVDPYYPSRHFPKLTTPMWVGEEGVEAVVILGIDDMRGHERWEAYLRPILRRLQKIDGRAPVSIMTCQIDPKDPHLQTWLKEGVSIETHTFDHPCPFFKIGFDKAKATYDKAVDLMFEIPNNKPVAFRMPCCDSMNTPSPRFYAEIFNKTTAKGNFLSIDTSVFNVFTSDDPELPRELVQLPDGSERFRRYLPKDRSFVNTIENYPYPYVIGRLCWEFPCVTPSDWQAQHYHKPNNPQTVKDLQAALDCTVVKQGVFCLVFHPHGWIRNDQIVELIDHAVKKHGKKVKFLTFREAQERLDKNLLADEPVRYAKNGTDNGVRLLDLDKDGHLDRMFGSTNIKDKTKTNDTALWNSEVRSWTCAESLGVAMVVRNDEYSIDWGVRFGIVQASGHPSAFARFSPHALNPMRARWDFNGRYWVSEVEGARTKGLPLRESPLRKRNDGAAKEQPVGGPTSMPLSLDPGFRLLDLNGDGSCEWMLGDAIQPSIYGWSKKKKAWGKLAFGLPQALSLVDIQFREKGVRFIDLDGDAQLDLIFSNEKEYGIYLFTDMKHGWSRKVMAGKAGDKGALPPIAKNGTNNGFFVHSRSLWWANEDTALLKDHVDRRSFNELLKDVEPQPLSPEASLKAMQPRPGFTVELMAAEPLVQDPIAFAWGPDGKFWVVEMGDYPLGVDGKNKFGGRVKLLEKTKPNDGPYDKATVFLDNLGYPTGVMAWDKGVLVTCAPDIFYAEDTDGDGKADKKVVILSGFGEGNQQHRVNGLVYGLDNWIYGANGDSGGKVWLRSQDPSQDQARKKADAVDIRGRDFRFLPHLGLDPQSGQSQFGRARDDWGNWFGNNNTQPMWHYALEDYHLRRNPHLPVPDPRIHVPLTPRAGRVYATSRTLPRFNSPGAENHITSACSTIVYRDDLFGPGFENNSFVSEPVHNLIHREVMTRKGVTFTSRRAADEETSEFLTSTDNWFRPTMIQTGPDGALWVADMYRHVIEHPEWIPKDWQKKLDLRAGHDKGRIYRVYPVNKKPRPIPRLDKLDTGALVAALESPSGWQRDMAQQLLVKKKDRRAIAYLAEVFRDSNSPLARLHALCTLQGIGGLREGILSRALTDKHPGVRRHAVRLCEPLLSEANSNAVTRTEIADLASALLKLIDDPDIQVRMELAYTLGYWDDPRAGAALGRLALKDGDDSYFLAAVMSSVNARHLEPVLEVVLKDGKLPGPLFEKLLRLADAYFHSQAMATLLSAVATPEKGRYRVEQFHALAALLDSLDQRNISLAKLGKGDKEVKAAVKKLEKIFDAARATVATPQAADRVAAVGLLGRGFDRYEDDIKVLGSLLAPQTPDDVQAAAISTLGKLKTPIAPALVLRSWKGLGPNLRTQALDMLLSRSDGVHAILDAVQSKKVLPFEIDAARRQRLLDHKNATVKQRAAKLLAATITSDRGKLLESYRGVLSMTGDPTRGLKIFAKSCASCHKLGGIGEDVGPNLVSVPDKSAEAMLTAILDPNQAVEARYVNYTAVTKNGLTYSGLIASETGTSLTLVGADGKKHALLRTELDELFSTGKSAMPEGLEKELPPPAMADLIAYLRDHLASPLPGPRSNLRKIEKKGSSGGTP